MTWKTTASNTRRKFGATHTINPTRDNLDEAIAEITGGRGAEISVEAAGYPDTLNNVFKHVSKFGRCIIFGLIGGTEDMTPLHFRQFFGNTPTIIPTAGAASGDAVGHIERMVELKERGWWDPGEMVTHRASFDDVKSAYDMYENRDDEIVKVVMSM